MSYLWRDHIKLAFAATLASSAHWLIHTSSVSAHWLTHIKRQCSLAHTDISVSAHWLTHIKRQCSLAHTDISISAHWLTHIKRQCSLAHTDISVSAHWLILADTYERSTAHRINCVHNNVTIEGVQSFPAAPPMHGIL